VNHRSNCSYSESLLKAEAALRALALATMLSIAAFPTYAQQSAAPAAGAAGQNQDSLEEIVVTSQYRSQESQKIPLSVTAISAATLEARGDVKLADVASMTPSLTLTPASGVEGPAPSIYIRGVGQFDVNPGESPGVGIYIDDVYYGSMLGANLDLIDLDRAEILRGPQGTLSGQNSIGGSVKLFSKRPDGNDGGSVQLTYGSFNDVELRGSADATLIDEHLFVRFSGATQHQDGYVQRLDYGCMHPDSGAPSSAIGTSCVLGTEGGTSYNAGRIAVRWVANDQLEVNVAADLTQNDSELGAQTLLYVPPATLVGTVPKTANGIPYGNASGSPFITYSPYGNYAQDTATHSPYVSYGTLCNTAPADGSAPYCLPGNNALKSGGVSADISYEINDNFALRSITADRSEIANWSADQSAAPVNNGFLQSKIESHQFTQELRLGGNLLDRKINYTVGGFYLDTSNAYDARVDDTGAGSDFLENDSIPEKTAAAFVNGDWHATDMVDVNAGVRYTHQQQTYNYGRAGLAGTTAPYDIGPFGPSYIDCPEPIFVGVCGINGTSKSYTSTHIDYRLAPQIQWTPNFMTYASFSTGFKGAGENPRPLILAQETSFAEETLKSYEIGFKSEEFDHRLRVNAAVFYSDYKDMQMSVLSCPQFGFSPAGCADILNAGSAVIKGVELETEWRPTHEFSVNASFSYLDFYFTSLTPNALESGITYSQQSPYINKWKGDIGTQYEINVGAAGTVTPRVDVSYQSSMQTSVPNDAPFTEIPGRTLADGSLAWRLDSKWEATFRVKNMFNKLYYLNVWSALTNPTSNVIGDPAPPREFFVSVKRNF
jgi:iron complex outermembrane receptor protein